MTKKRPTRTVHVADASTMRVLAHPTRLSLLGLLRQDGPRTAAQLGDVVDEAPGTVSYHLGRLASAGLIEEAAEQGSDRRERWWRSTHDVTSWEPAELLDDPERLLASTAMQRTIVQHYSASLNQYLDAVPTMAPEWVRAGASGDRMFSLTVQELSALRGELEAVMSRYAALSDQREDERQDERGDERQDEPGDERRDVRGDEQEGERATETVAESATAPVTLIYHAFRRP